MQPYQTKYNPQQTYTGYAPNSGYPPPTNTNPYGTQQPYTGQGNYPYQPNTGSPLGPNRYPNQHPGQLGSYQQQMKPGVLSGPPGPQAMYTNPQMHTMQPQMQQMQPQLPPKPQQNWYSSIYNQIAPQELQALQRWFTTVDRDRSGSIEAEELQQVTFDGRPIGLDVAKRLIQVFDKDKNGSIDFQEYATMHKFLSQMRQAFIYADADKSGRIDAREIHQALANAGFSFLSMSSIQELMVKYDKTKAGLDWNQFLLMVAHVALCRSVFQWNDKEGKGFITLNEDQFLHVSAYILPN